MEVLYVSTLFLAIKQAYPSFINILAGLKLPNTSNTNIEPREATQINRSTVILLLGTNNIFNIVSMLTRFYHILYKNTFPYFFGGEGEKLIFEIFYM